MQQRGEQRDAVDDARARVARGRRSRRSRRCGRRRRPASGQRLEHAVGRGALHDLVGAEPTGRQHDHLGCGGADGVPRRAERRRRGWPSASRPPASATCSGTQCPAANGGSSHSTTTVTGARAPPHRRRWPRRALPAARGELVARRVGAGRPCDGADALDDPAMPAGSSSSTVGAGPVAADERPHRAARDGADGAQRLGHDQVGCERVEHGLVDAVELLARLDRARHLGGRSGRVERRRVDAGQRDGGQVGDVDRPVALVAAADQRRPQSSAQTISVADGSSETMRMGPP